MMGGKVRVQGTGKNCDDRVHCTGKNCDEREVKGTAYRQEL